MEKTARMKKRKQAIRRVLARWFDHRETENGNKADKAAETAADTVKMVTDDRKEPARPENSTGRKTTVADGHGLNRLSPKPVPSVQMPQRHPLSANESHDKTAEDPLIRPGRQPPDRQNPPGGLTSMFQLHKSITSRKRIYIFKRQVCHWKQDKPWMNDRPTT